MRYVWRYIPAVLLVVIIFALSDIPNLHLYDDKALTPFWKDLIRRYTIRIGTTGFFSYTLSPHPDFVLHKLGHIGVYASLGIALFLAAKRAGLAVLLSMLYAIADEIHQGFVTGRSCRFWDIVLDTVAAAAAIWLLQRYLQKREEKAKNSVNDKTPVS